MRATKHLCLYDLAGKGLDGTMLVWPKIGDQIKILSSRVLLPYHHHPCLWTTSITTERACIPPCVVLVINDNFYRLMCKLSFMCRFVHWHRLGHVLVSRLKI